MMSLGKFTALQTWPKDQFAFMTFINKASESGHAEVAMVEVMASKEKKRFGTFFKI